MPPHEADRSKLAGAFARAGAQRQHERTATRLGFDQDGAAVRVYIAGLNRQPKEHVTNGEKRNPGNAPEQAVIEFQGKHKRKRAIVLPTSASSYRQKTIG